MLLLLHPNKFIHIIPALCGLREYLLLDRILELRGAGEDPEVFGGAAADEDPLVVGVEQEDAVVGVEGTEEGDLEDRRGVGQFGFAFGVLGFAVLDAGVKHVHLAVGAEGILRRGMGEAALEDVVEAGDLVPGAEVFVEAEGSRGGCVIHLLGGACATSKQCHKQGDY